MADAHGKKRGRPGITDSERKRRKIVRKKSYEQSRVYLGNEIDRWNVIKHNHSLQNDREVATFLIDRYQHIRAAEVPGPSRLTSTPGSLRNIASTPSVSGVSASETEMRGDRHQHIRAAEVPGPSRLTSTPGSLMNVVSTPSVSGVSASETEMRGGRHGHLDLSGLDEMESSGDNKTQKQESCTEGGKTSRTHMVKKLSSSFIDPSDISINVAHIEEEDFDEEDPDYEPSVLITSVLPSEIEEQCADVAYEEAEFGMEKDDDDRIEDEDIEEEVISDGITVIKTNEDCVAATKACKCICFVDQLLILAQLKCGTCPTCGTDEIEILEKYIGSALYLHWTCKKGHMCLKWCSQPLLNRRMHCGDFLLCSTILTSGNNFSKLKLWASMLHMTFPSANQFHGIQRSYLIPTVDSFWSEHQKDLLRTFQDKEVVVLGDGRNDSPMLGNRKTTSICRQLREQTYYKYFKRTRNLFKEPIRNELIGIKLPAVGLIP